MKNITKLYLLVGLSFFMMVTAQENIIISGAVSNSLVFSTERSETDRAYILDINIEGLSPELLDINIKGQNLIIEAKQGNVSSISMAGGQLIHYSFSFEKSANLQHLKRVNYKNKVKLIIPKK